MTAKSSLTADTYLAGSAVATGAFQAAIIARVQHLIGRSKVPRPVASTELVAVQYRAPSSVRRRATSPPVPRDPPCFSVRISRVLEPVS
jgi:hypothetical protein